MAWIANCMASPVADVRVESLAARLAVAAQRDQVDVAVVARRLVDVGMAPRIQRHRLREIRAVPFRDVALFGAEPLQPLLRRRIAADVEAILLERLLERDDLRACPLDLG